VGVARVIMGIDDSLGGSATEPLGEFENAPTLDGKRHRVDNDRPFLGPKHGDISTNAIDHVDRVSHLLVIESGDSIVDVDGQRSRQCDRDRRNHPDFSIHISSRNDAPEVYAAADSKHREPHTGVKIGENSTRSPVQWNRAAPQREVVDFPANPLNQVSVRRGWGLPKSQP